MKKDRIQEGVCILLVVSLFALFALASSEDESSSTTEKLKSGITKIVIFDSSYKLEVGETEKDYISVTCDKEFADDDIIFVSESPDVATISFEKRGALINTNLHYIIVAVHTGETKIFAQTKDGKVKSEEIIVTVTGRDTVKLEEGIKSMYFDDSDINLEEGKTFIDYIRVNYYMTISIDDIEIINTSPEVASFECNDISGIFITKINYLVTAISPGETKIYVTTKDGSVKSNTITVTVTEKSPWIEAAGNIYIGVKLFSVTEGGSIYVGKVVDIDFRHYSPYTGNTFSGIQLEMPDGTYEWKDRNALLANWPIFIKSDDPFLPWNSN